MEQTPDPPGEAAKTGGVHQAALRPSNYTRNALHISSMFVALAVIGGNGGTWKLTAIAVGYCLFTWTVEYSRRKWPSFNDRMMTALGRVSHAHEEHSITSATWYATSLMILGLVNSVPPAVVGVTALGAGDPIAAIVGRKWGRTKTMNGRSLEGSIAFALAAFAATFVVLRFLVPSATLIQVEVVALAGAVVGAISEMMCRRVDDNFAIPLWSAGAAAVAALATGLPLF
jgi:dolichol kinase